MLLIEPHYFPSVSWFAEAIAHDRLLLENAERFQKQTARNRCTFPAANKAEKLSVPLLAESRKESSKFWLIDHRIKWINVHRRAIISAYGKAPYYEYYAPELLAVFDNVPEKLMDFQVQIIRLCLKILNCRAKISFTEEWKDDWGPEVTDRRSGAEKRPVPEIHFPAYNQVFENEFYPDASVLDLFFCLGPEARIYLLNLNKKA